MPYLLSYPMFMRLPWFSGPLRHAAQRLRRRQSQVRCDHATRPGSALAAGGRKGAATVRIGMDGAWVGADKRDSYFVLDVSPGLHHLCASWQSSQEASNRGVELFALNTEPG